MVAGARPRDEVVTSSWLNIPELTSISSCVLSGWSSRSYEKVSPPFDGGEIRRGGILEFDRREQTYYSINTDLPANR